MAITLDLRKAHANHLRGDILQVFTWVNDERAMVLLPALRRPGSPWFVVCESAAWKYDNPEYLARQSKVAAEVLGMDETTSTWFRVASLIHDGLSDLIRMPAKPEPEKLRLTVGELKVFADGQLVGGEEIRLDSSDIEYGAPAHA